MQTPELAGLGEPSVRYGRTSRWSDGEIQREMHNAIVRGRLRPGTKLSESQLGDIFQVSRTRIRPVLHRLAQRGIVVIEPRRGAFVASPSLQEARAVNAARRIYEEGIVRQVVRNVTPGQLEQLRENLNLEMAARLRSDFAAAHELTGEFHLMLAQFTGNNIVVAQLRDLISRDSLAVALYQRQSQVSCSLVGHKRLTEAIEAKDEDGAALCMVEHLAEVEASLLAGRTFDGEDDLRAAFPELSRSAAPPTRPGGSGAKEKKRAPRRARSAEVR